MNYKVIAIVVIAILLVSSGLYLHFRNKSSQTSTIPQLSQGNIMLTGQCYACSYDNSKSYSVTQQEQDINMLKGLGFTSIRVDLGYDAWLQSNQAWIQKETQVINYLKSQGLTLIIADASAEYYRSHPLAWTQFKESWVQRVSTFASLFHPDYYLVIKEPGWYVPMVSDARTSSTFQSYQDWENLSSWLANTVLSISPLTQIGVSVSASGFSNEPTFYNAFFMHLPSQVAIMGFDTYSPSDNANMQAFLQKFGNQGKTVWDGEAWSQASANSNQNTDPAWLASQYNLCVSLGISELNPFYSNNFVTYSTSLPSSFVASTPVAQEMQKIAQLNG